MKVNKRIMNLYRNDRRKFDEIMDVRKYEDIDRAGLISYLETEGINSLSIFDISFKGWTLGAAGLMISSLLTSCGVICDSSNFCNAGLYGTCGSGGLFVASTFGIYFGDSIKKRVKLNGNKTEEYENLRQRTVEAKGYNEFREDGQGVFWFADD